MGRSLTARTRRARRTRPHSTSSSGSFDNRLARPGRLADRQQLPADVRPLLVLRFGGANRWPANAEPAVAEIAYYARRGYRPRKQDPTKSREGPPKRAL